MFTYTVDEFKKKTANGDLDWLLKLSLGATKDAEGAYHIDQDYWQSWHFVGYNDFYDWAFDFGIRATGGTVAYDKFPFIGKDGKEYIIWVWKGGYISLVKYKVFVCIGVICCMCFLSSCSLFRSRELSQTDAQLKILSDTAQIIVNALEENDLMLLDTILSTKAKATSDLNDGFIYSCALLDSKVVKVEQLGCPVSKYMEGGKFFLKSNASFQITTESGAEFSLYFEYYYSNDFDEMLNGVNRIKLTDRSMIDDSFIPGRLYERSGIYCASWDSE